jgi:hypothetical protein
MQGTGIDACGSSDAFVAVALARDKSLAPASLFFQAFVQQPLVAYPGLHSIAAAQSGIGAGDGDESGAARE